MGTNKESVYNSNKSSPPEPGNRSPNGSPAAPVLVLRSTWKRSLREKWQRWLLLKIIGYCLHPGIYLVVVGRQAQQPHDCFALAKGEIESLPQTPPYGIEPLEKQPRGKDAAR